MPQMFRNPFVVRLLKGQSTSKAHYPGEKNQNKNISYISFKPGDEPMKPHWIGIIADPNATDPSDVMFIDGTPYFPNDMLSLHLGATSEECLFLVKYKNGKFYQAKHELIAVCSDELPYICQWDPL